MKKFKDVKKEKQNKEDKAVIEVKEKTKTEDENLSDNIKALKKKTPEVEEITFEELSDGYHKDIISLFNDISKPFDDGKGEKEAIMLDLLSEYGAFYEEKVGIRIPALTDKPDIVCVSHIDLISTFNRGFAKGRVYSLAKYKGKEIIVGALDNTMTNAVVMLSLIQLRSKGLAKNVEFLFTEGEEINLLGMKAYLRKYSNKPFFINLDVTNDNLDYNSSIEYDKPNWSICKQIDVKQDLFTSGITTERWCDDLDAVIDAKGNGFSYCLPTWKTIHSYKNYTLVENLVPYLDGLTFLLSELDISSVEPNIEQMSVKKALKYEDEKKFLKKEKKLKKKEEARRKKRFGSFSNYHGSRPSYGGTNYDSWNHSVSHSIPSTDFDIHDDYNVDDFGQGRIFYDYGNKVVSEEEMLKNMVDSYDDISEDDDMSLVQTNDIYELEQVIQTAITSAEDYDIEVDKYIKGFISENVMGRTQWTIDDLAGHISCTETAQKLIDAWDDYYVLDTIEPGVYEFKKDVSCHA